MVDVLPSFLRQVSSRKIKPRKPFPFRKPKEKKRGEEELEQASKAVATFYESENRHHDAILALNNKKEKISTKKTIALPATCSRLLRHPHDSGTARPQRRKDNHDLHAHDQAGMMGFAGSSHPTEKEDVCRV